MIWGGFTLLEKVYTTGQLSPAMQLPMAYVYAVLPLSGVIISYYSVLFIAEAVLDFFGQRAPAQAITEEKI